VFQDENLGHEIVRPSRRGHGGMRDVTNMASDKYAPADGKLNGDTVMKKVSARNYVSSVRKCLFLYVRAARLPPASLPTGHRRGPPGLASFIPAIASFKTHQRSDATLHAMFHLHLCIRMRANSSFHREQSPGRIVPVYPFFFRLLDCRRHRPHLSSLPT
jgi:hypothetical protein